MDSLRLQSGSAQRVLIQAPAKVNLTLEILARLADGFHELETFMLAVSVCDTLVFEATSSPELNIHCEWAIGLLAQRASARRSHAAEVWQPLPPTTDNLVWKALDRLRREARVTTGARVELTKRIPAQAGLGGASADAAAVLLAANVAWQLYWPIARLAELAAQLGSDVPFFLNGGAAICRGRGEQIEVVRPPRCSLVIVRPPVGLSTSAVYKSCRPAATRQAAIRLQRELARGDLAAAARALHNGLQPPAEAISPWIGKLKQVFASTGCIAHQMSGSGSSYFGLCWHAGEARRIARWLRGMNLGAVMTAETHLRNSQRPANEFAIPARNGHDLP